MTYLMSSLMELSNKILNGKEQGHEIWNQFLVEAHGVAPSMTPAMFASYRTQSGKTSYELLANETERYRETASTILDLACGDGYLIQYLLPVLGPKGSVVGVDMSEGEMNIAKEKYKSNSQVEIFKARAQALPFADNSIDCIVCHMAIMLMQPLDLVVQEVSRILKGGGQFSAVIDRGFSQGGLFQKVQNKTSQFILNLYPKMKNFSSGDSRIQSEVGVKEVFSPSLGFSKNIEFMDFSLCIDVDSMQIWSLVKDTYFVSMLPDDEKNQLKLELIDFVKSESSNSERVQLEFEMKLISVEKLK